MADGAAFERCLREPRTLAAVDRDARAGAGAGVQVTPTLVINGVAHPGALTEAELEKIVAAAVR